MESRLGSATRDPDLLRRVTDAACLVHAAIRHVAFDNLVTQQREHTPADEQWPSVAVPIDARSATRIVRRLLRLRAELADLFEVQPIVAQKQDCGGVFKQMTKSGASGAADRQTQHARVCTVGFVEETVTAQLTLRSAFADVVVGYFR